MHTFKPYEWMQAGTSTGGDDKMKTLLGIVASPRKYGNCELFLKELYLNLPQDAWSLKLIRLSELNIQPCLGCYQCLFGEMKCVQRDDLQLFLDALVSADAVAVAVPTYFLGANASLKRLLDRGLTFYGHLDALWGKPAVGAAIAGVPGLEGYTKLIVDSFLKLSLTDHRGSEVVYGALPGEIFLNGDGKAAAARLAEALCGGGSEGAGSAPRCSVCGGDTFRFLPETDPRPDGAVAVRCMLCSSAGTLKTADGRIQIATRPSEHPLFLTREDAERHLEWLRGMKEAFLVRHKELKAVVQAYTAIGEWIRPENRSG